MVAQLSKEAKPVVAAATEQATKATTNTANTILPSLGASGAIYATVTLTALAFPHTEISLIIPPSFPIPIQWGVGAFVGLDILGALRGWRYVPCFRP
jgi:rhomboid-like protein